MKSITRYTASIFTEKILDDYRLRNFPFFASIMILYSIKFKRGIYGRRVLEVKDGKALIITEKLIDCIKYNHKYEAVTWKTCTLRNWMNNDFYDAAFSRDEKARIATLTVKTPDNPRYGIDGGKSTKDKVFALSIDEADRYIKNDNDRMSTMTQYSKKRGIYSRSNHTLPNGDESGCWWLRSPGLNSCNAAYVNLGGDIHYKWDRVGFYNIGVRPVVWIIF